jgi:hypothetical protein
MQYVKMLGLVAAVAMALMAFGVGTASATTLTSPTGTVYKGEIVASVDHSVLLVEEGFGTVTCTTGVVKGKPNAQSDTTTVTGSISTLTFGEPRLGGTEEESECEGQLATINVLKRGSLEIHVIGTGPNGTLTSSGAEVTVTKFGIHCIYSTNNTDLGTLTGSTTTKGQATMDINAKLNRVATSPFCAEHATWEGAYVVTAPSFLNIS